MSERGYCKCACSYCQGRIEFPAHAVGVTTACPHCGVETTLTAAVETSAAPPPPPPPSAAAPAVAEMPATFPAGITPVGAASAGSKLRQVLRIASSIIAGMVVLGLIGLKFWRGYRQTKEVVESVRRDNEPAQPQPSPQPSASPPAPAPPPTSELVARGLTLGRKPDEDLQVLSFEVQKARDGNLQYIVGVVTNHSAKQYFNVKLEFDLTRKDGRAGNPATDTIRNLAPNAGVTFKANIIGTAPVAAAKLAKLGGEKE